MPFLGRPIGKCIFETKFGFYICFDSLRYFKATNFCYLTTTTIKTSLTDEWKRLALTRLGYLLSSMENGCEVMVCNAHIQPNQSPLILLEYIA